METIVLNLLGGPCAGKSTVAAGIFHKLKCNNIDCELVGEYAKDCVWDKSLNIMDDQVFVFGHQYHRIWRLIGQVQVAIADSPLLLSIYYKNFESEYFDKLVLELFNRMNNLTYVLDRNTEFVENGRVHTEEQSKYIDNYVDNLLHDNNIDHKHVNTTEAVDTITNEILDLLNNHADTK